MSFVSMLPTCNHLECNKVSTMWRKKMQVLQCSQIWTRFWVQMWFMWKSTHRFMKISWDPMRLTKSLVYCAPTKNIAWQPFSHQYQLFSFAVPLIYPVSIRVGASPSFSRKKIVLKKKNIKYNTSFAAMQLPLYYALSPSFSTVALSSGSL